VKRPLPVEGVDYYVEGGGRMVFTADYHLRRGYCCRGRCRHCPWKDVNASRHSTQSVAPDVEVGPVDPADPRGEDLDPLGPVDVRLGSADQKHVAGSVFLTGIVEVVDAIDV